MFHVMGVFRIFFKKKASIFVIFSSVFFSAEYILSNLSNKNNSRGSGGMLPRKHFKNLHTASAILVLFEQFLGKVCSYFWPITLSASPMMHFVCTVSNLRALRRLRHIVMKRFEFKEKFYSSKTLLKMAGGGCMRSKPHIPPGIRLWLYNNKDGLKFKRNVFN